VGISFDSVEAQKSFAAEESFPYRLLSDPDRSVGKAYDAERQEGEPYFEHGLPRRVSYLIRPGGEIAKAYDLDGHPDLSEHAAEVLADVQELS
jgi:thioredoxin-dependent peroxiredoxin